VNILNSSSSKTGSYPDISAIIPVFNEAGKVGRVLETLRYVDRISEIIVVDDGSTDSSVEEVKLAAQSDSRLRLLQNSINLGKGQAIFSGWQSTKSSCLLLLDGDLFGLNPDHVQDLMKPVLDHQADMAIGQFKNGNWASDFSHWVTPWLSGQRSLRANLLGQISSKAAEGYGFETALTVAARQFEWQCTRVSLPGVWHLPSEARRGLWTGFSNRASMYGQITSAWYQAGGLHRFGLRPRVR
jgi:glycosyltransferase involved in cell wall biosynthesis